MAIMSSEIRSSGSFSSILVNKSWRCGDRQKLGGNETGSSNTLGSNSENDSAEKDDTMIP